MAMRVATAQQTIGPFWHLIGDSSWADLMRFGAAGRPIVLTGRVLDAAGAAVGDACVELWQADPQASEIFPGFGRCGTDEEGKFRFRTLRPGALRRRENSAEAPHVALAIHARGLTRPLFTRVYFAGEALNEKDRLLSRIADAERKASLIAREAGKDGWEIDIRLGGARETVFLEI